MTSQPSAEPIPVRYVDDLATLRALSDPLRLAIVNLLMDGAHREPKVRSAKELARQLAQPQTRLYRHLKQLQATGLIAVAETRLVAGIMEHRYRTGQLALRINEAFLGGTAPTDDALHALSTAVDRHRDDLFTEARAGTLHLDAESAPPNGVRPAIAALHATIPLARAQDFAARLTAVVNEFVALQHDPEGVTTNLLVMYHEATSKEPTGHLNSDDHVRAPAGADLRQTDDPP